ncbi:HalOD1 output domain-containing protein [Halomicrococcus gelatinilyticus]|uniref:HalOD1 output domain-containing protein n=1 Tax=Halomicrococcus gelatinilyticus TaxID=1702103 RepID=UPI002E10D42B
MNGNVNDENAVTLKNTERATQYTTYADDEPLSTAVVVAIADAAGVDPADIGTPLYDIMDPDALDNLFSDKIDGSPRIGGQVVFTVLDYEVTVYSYGQIVVRDLN